MEIYKSDKYILLKNCMLCFNRFYNYTVCDITKNNPAKAANILLPYSVGACGPNYGENSIEQVEYWKNFFNTIYLNKELRMVEDEISFNAMKKGFIDSINPVDKFSLD